MQFTIPLRLPSLPNERLHWRALDQLKRQQKDTTAIAILVCGQVVPPLPLHILITRVGPRKLDDDNLEGACKYVRDTIATRIGVDDGSDQYTWEYRQRIGKYEVEVVITPR